MTQQSRAFRAAVAAAICLLLSACKDDSGGGAAPPHATSTVPDSGASLTISGKPASQAAVGASYEFLPVPGTAAANTLTFSIANAPHWADFDPTTGRLSGIPQSGDLGSYAGIVITASDGVGSAQLGPFAIVVGDTFTGTATLSWLPPTANEDGTALSWFRGYRIRYGQSANRLNQSVKLTNPSITRYMVENLAPGTWYFTIVTLAAEGVESDPSAMVSKTIF